MKILVLEDNAIIQILYKSHLQEDEALIFTYGQKAVKAAKKENFDALILDVGLPDGSGLDFGDDILDCQENLPILISSASSVFEAFKFYKLKNHKNLMFLEKHVKGDNLKDALNNFKYKILEHLGCEDLKKNICYQRH